MGRTKTSSGRLPREDELQPYLLEPTGPISWQDLFGNDHPVEVEVGSGKGLFLISAATQFPKRNFFGIEIARKFARFTAGRLAKRSLANARIAQADARRVLTEWLPVASVAALHVYFPDTWWKRRHKKRRIFTESFVTQISRVLVPHGELHVASDVEEYFREIEQLLNRHAAFSRAESARARHAEHDLDYLTNFERKYRKVGKLIYRSHFVRLCEQVSPAIDRG